MLILFVGVAMNSSDWPSLEDTIAALSSPWPMFGECGRSVIRISGPDTMGVAGEIAGLSASPAVAGVFEGAIFPAGGLVCPSCFYIFRAPRSYTGQDLAEIHTFVSRPVLELVLEGIFGRVRQAGPGEFTLRAYLNGKLDLSQAEAVAHIVSASNQAQLEAAKKLFEGKLGDTIESLRGGAVELLGLIEAGLDFSDQDIEFISARQTKNRIDAIVESLNGLLETSLRCEYFIELPAVGLAGVPSAGKSSLLNALTGTQRSIVSDSRGTTRDVLRQMLTLPCGDCVLFDCAGLGDGERQSPLESLAIEAARRCLACAELAILCLDVSKPDWDEESALLSFVRRQRLIPVAAKSDLLDSEQISRQIKRLKSLFGMDFLPVSAATGFGLAELRNIINTRLLEIRAPAGQTDQALALNQRHRQSITEAADALAAAGELVSVGQDEVAAMFVRSAIRHLARLQAEDLSEQVLENIFSRFCIGK